MYFPKLKICVNTIADSKLYLMKIKGIGKGTIKMGMRYVIFFKRWDQSTIF